MDTTTKEKGAGAIVDQSRDSEMDRWLELFSILIHDMESPLASIKYLLKLLREDKLDMSKPVHQRLVASSQVALERSESIFYDIMAVAKAGKVGVPVAMTTVEVEPVIKDAILLISAHAEERSIEIVYRSDGKRLRAEADPNLLRRVLDNLLYNAVRHTPDASRIQVSLESGQESVFVHVKDAGAGLGEIDPARLFEKYGQLEMRRDGKHRGVGLGLYFCRLAATGMGATMLADDHPDGGSVFSIKLRKAKG
jgi:K+-sensing histidine kinase KdpD